MKSEIEILEMLKTNMYIYFKSGSDEYLGKMLACKEILDMSLEEFERIYNEIERKMKKIKGDKK